LVQEHTTWIAGRGMGNKNEKGKQDTRTEWWYDLACSLLCSCD
jgi:hypothetical protein